ncbi:MAG: class II aldolase/adducin family protein, partial [Candidatus Rokuibacteriota bacterium]
MGCGILPLSQPAMIVSGTLASHPYDVAEEGPEERARLAADLGDKHVMLLHNHGLLVCGRTAAEAFLYHYFTQQACEIQVDALGAGADHLVPSREVRTKVSAWGAPRAKPWGGTPWAALMRMLDRADPSFRS